MPQHPVSPTEAPARALALMVAANGCIDEQELQTLGRLDAFARLGISRDRFVVLARDCLAELGAHLCQRSWLSMDHTLQVDRILDAVVDPQQRLLVCRLAAAVITADGRVSHDERLVYERALVRWRIRQPMVPGALLADGAR